MWWISTWLLVAAAFVVGWAVRAGLTRGQGEAPAQHIRNAMQLLLAVDACALPSVAAQECLESAYQRLLLAVGQLELRVALPSSRLRAAPATRARRPPDADAWRIAPGNTRAGEPTPAPAKGSGRIGLPFWDVLTR